MAFHVDLFIKLMEACIEGKIVHAQAHMNFGELLFSIVSKMENPECRTSEDSALGFAKIGKLLWKSQSSSITLYLLSILQSLLPAHAAGKDSPRTLACRKVVMNQGWSKDIVKESFNAIGKMDKKLYPDHLMKCINIFAQDRTILRPKAFQLTSFIIDDEDQITSYKSKKDLKDGHLALYIDQYCCRFTQLYGNDGHESPRIFAHTEVEDFTRLDTKDGESTAEASDLEAMVKSVKNQRPQTLKGKAEKKPSAIIAGQLDPPAPADKGADGKRKARFSSLQRSISPRININETSELQPGSKAYSTKPTRPYKVRVPVDVIDEEDSMPTPQGTIKENEGDEKTQKAGKGEKMGKIKVQKPEWETAESNADVVANWDEGGISPMGKMSTLMTRSTKIYGSRGSRSSSSRRPIQSRLPPLPMESSDSELDVKPLSPPISNRSTSLFQSKSKKKDVDGRNKATPAIRAPALKSRTKSLASSIAEGRAATPVSRGPTPVIGDTKEEPFGATGGNVGSDGKVVMGKSGRVKKDKNEEKTLPVAITALIPEPSSTSRRALTKKPFSLQSSDEEEPLEAEPWTKVGRKTLQSQTQSKLKDRGPSIPPTKDPQSDNEPLKKRAITRDLDCDPMAEGETETPQNKLAKKTTRKSTTKATTSPQEKRVRALPVRGSEPTLQPKEYHSQASRLNQRDVIDLPSLVTVQGVTNPRRSKANKRITHFDDEDDDEQVQELEEEDDEEPQAKKRGGRPTRGTTGQDNGRNKKQKQISRSQPDGSNSQSNSDLSSDSDYPPTTRDKALSSKNKTEIFINSKATKAKPKTQSEARKNKSYKLESSEDEESSTDNQTSEPHSGLNSDSDPEEHVKRGIKLTTGQKLLTATVPSRSTKTKAQTKEISSFGRPSISSRPSKKCKRLSENESEGEDEEEENKKPPPNRTKKAQSSVKRKRDDTPSSEEESEALQPSPKLVKVARKGPGKTMKKGKMENKKEEIKAEEEPLKISDLLSGISKAMKKRVNTRSRMR
ncbi:hypothetical protein I310_00063 [Cryptococcus deuterogattii CA1014]|nr:hypothetical protein I310_00063 [Cryptococcus deuterogattii CA1014]